MMQPLSRNKRRYYLVALTVLFIFLTPTLIYYASGYRITDSFTLNRTGGLYIMTGESGVKVYINGELYKESSVFQKNVLVQDLKPGSFTITTEKDGNRGWNKDLEVYPEIVTEARVLMLPIEPEVAEILPYLDTEGLATSTPTSAKKIRFKHNPDFAEVTELFLPTKKTATSTERMILKNASTSPEAKINGKLILDRNSNKIIATWAGEESESPSYFCLEKICKKKIEIKTLSAVKKFDFLPNRGDVVLVLLEKGLYAVEIDDRSTQNTQPVYLGQNLDMRISGSTVYIKAGEKIISISF